MLKFERATKHLTFNIKVAVNLEVKKVLFVWVSLNSECATFNTAEAHKQIVQFAANLKLVSKLCNLKLISLHSDRVPLNNSHTVHSPFQHETCHIH